jgi:hypothetical protein
MLASRTPSWPSLIGDHNNKAPNNCGLRVAAK